MGRDYPKTTLTLCKALFTQIERTAQPPQAQLNTSLIKIKAWLKQIKEIVHFVLNEPQHQNTHNSLKTKRFNHSRHYTHIVHFVFVPVEPERTTIADSTDSRI